MSIEPSHLRSYARRVTVLVLAAPPLLLLNLATLSIATGHGVAWISATHALVSAPVAAAAFAALAIAHLTATRPAPEPDAGRVTRVQLVALAFVALFGSTAVGSALVGDVGAAIVAVVAAVAFAITAGHESAASRVGTVDAEALERLTRWLGCRVPPRPSRTRSLRAGGTTEFLRAVVMCAFVPWALDALLTVAGQMHGPESSLAMDALTSIGLAGLLLAFGCVDATFYLRARAADCRWMCRIFLTVPAVVVGSTAVTPVAYLIEGGSVKGSVLLAAFGALMVLPPTRVACRWTRSVLTPTPEARGGILIRAELRRAISGEVRRERPFVPC